MEYQKYTMKYGYMYSFSKTEYSKKSIYLSLWGIVVVEYTYKFRQIDLQFCYNGSEYRYQESLQKEPTERQSSLKALKFVKNIVKTNEKY